MKFFRFLIFLLIFPSMIIYSKGNDENHSLSDANSKMEEKNMNYDSFKTPEGEIQIFFIGHGTLYFQFKNKTIHIDPWTQLADYSQLPKADIILITHDHPDHLDPKAISQISKDNTLMIVNQSVADKLNKGKIMANGDSVTEEGIQIEAVPAYNTSPDRLKFHPKGIGNGYVISLGGMKFYLAGDTEDIPEMTQLKNIDVAFLPMNQPYTMLPEQVKKAALSFMPKILYPYHFGESDTDKLIDLLKDEPSIEVRIRNLQ